MGRGSWQRRWTWLCLAAQGWAGTAGWAQEPTKYSQEWWAWRAQDPPGARQVEKKGKLWPPFPRPQGEPQRWEHQYHHAHYWPYPYNEQDEAYVRQLLEQQANNGWIAATTLQDYHFHPETQGLNSAGFRQLQWILTQTPPAYRSVYVASGSSPQVGSARVQSVHEALQDLATGDAVPVVLRPSVLLYTRPAEEIDYLRRMELQSTPRPRLFVVGTGSRGMGSGGVNNSGGTGSGATSGGNAGSGSGNTR